MATAKKAPTKAPAKKPIKPSEVDSQFRPGNRFWERRSSHGRKPVFDNPEQLWSACCEYFEWVEQNPLMEMRPFAYQGVVVQEPVAKMRAMTNEGLCLFLDIGTSTWSDYRKRPDFSEVVTRVDGVMRTQKFTGAAADLLNPNIIARDLGLADKSELTGANGGAIKTEATVTLSPSDAYKRMLDGD
ncbi:MAG: DNA-packaging protein [Armatimonadia bacterium]